jgi:O-acetyl-ADP-ribose deacetylase (regulator of RNase III)
MDLLLLNASVYDLPSSRRVGAIVYDGASDLRLWPGPGTDRLLLAAYGPALPKALQTEREKLEGGELELGGLVRVHPGKLHCDFLVWAALRAPEPGDERSSAPGAAAIGAAVDAALRFVASRNVVRVAFPALGAGPGEIAADERLAIVVRAASQYADRCLAEGTPPVLEEVLVCDPSSATLAAARRKVAGSVRAPEPERKAPSSEASPPKRKARDSAVGGSPKRSSRRAPPRLDEDAVAHARATKAPYDRNRVYGTGDWFLHPRFGAGRVESLTPEGALVVLFEDGEQRKMVHGRT